jgi:hypothetical protein
MNRFKNYFLFFLVVLFTITCSDPSTKEKNKKTLRNYLIQYFLSIKPADNGELAAKIFYINPALKSGSSLNLDLVSEATSANVTLGKKKLILVHGWDYTDRDTTNLSTTQQKTRIVTDSWGDFIKTSTFDLIVASKLYDIYGFDYLTSNSIDTNGKRFRARMDALFSKETGTVVILAHSMGGIVSRFAVYESTKPAYLSRVISTGAPYHGSPWASPQFQADKGTLGNIAGFLTGTNGGKDLAWDNFDGKITGATNSKLTTINQKIDRDDLFYAYYGSVLSSQSSGGSGASSPGLYLSCSVLGSSFSPSDCVVPASSASLSGNTLKLTRDLGQYDHFDVKLTTQSMRDNFYSDLP